MKLAHLVLATDCNLMLLLHLHLLIHPCSILRLLAWHDAAAIFGLIYNLDCGDIGAITLIVLELHIVIEKKVHETTLLILW